MKCGDAVVLGKAACIGCRKDCGLKVFNVEFESVGVAFKQFLAILYCAGSN